MVSITKLLVVTSFMEMLTSISMVTQTARETKNHQILPAPCPLDPEVEAMLTKLNLSSLKTIFVQEELTISDLAKITNDQLSKIGVQKIKHILTQLCT